MSIYTFFVLQPYAFLAHNSEYNRLDHTSYRHQASSWRHNYRELYMRTCKYDNKLSSSLYLLPHLCFLHCLLAVITRTLNLNHLRGRQPYRLRNNVASNFCYVYSDAYFFAQTFSYFIPGQPFLETFMPLSYSNQDHTFMGDYIIPALKQQTQLLLHLQRNISRSDKEPLQFCLSILETFILHSKIYRTTNYWQHAKCLLNPFIPVFLLI